MYSPEMRARERGVASPETTATNKQTYANAYARESFPHKKNALCDALHANKQRPNVKPVYALHGV